MLHALLTSLLAGVSRMQLVGKVSLVTPALETQLDQNEAESQCSKAVLCANQTSAAGL